MKISYQWLRDYVDVTLPADELAARLTRAGLNVESLEAVGQDQVLEIETFSNRPDHLGHVGVAREVAWICSLPLKSVPTIPQGAEAGGGEAARLTSVAIEDPARSPRYIACLAFEVQVAPSPAWLRTRIETLGLRPVNNVVDLSNYVLFETGQPLHAFDFDRLAEQRIVVRRARARESFRALNGRTYELSPEDLVIADAARPVALAGVMGGLESEVGTHTKRVLLESAWFEPLGIRRTARRHQLTSDAAYRFERRVDPEGVEAAARRFLYLLREIAGAHPVPGMVEVCSRELLPVSRRRIQIRPSRIERVLGYGMGESEVQDGLERLGFDILRKEPDLLTVETPSWRGDVEREIDLIEELARLRGFEAIPEAELTTFPVVEDPARTRLEQVKTLMVAAGYREALTFSFVEGKEFESIERLWSVHEPYEVHNPVRTPERFLRRSLLPNLLASVRLNRHRGIERVRLFEIARVFLPARDDSGRPHESFHLAWCHSGGEHSLRDLRGIADGVGSLLSGPELDWQPHSSENPGPGGAGCFARSRSGDLLGLLERRSLDGVVEEVWAGELCLDPLLEATSARRVYQEFSRFPGVRRDLNFVLAEAVSWKQVHAEIQALDLAHLAEIRFVDLYRGKQVGEGKKSVTFSMLFQSAERTLFGEEVDARVQRVISSIEQALGGTIRKT